jgi:hypothetical protein
MKVFFMLRKVLSRIRGRAMYSLINARKICLNISSSLVESSKEFRSKGFVKIYSPGLSEILNAKFDLISNVGTRESNNGDVILDKSGNIKTVWLDLEDEFFWNYKIQC